MLSTCVQSRQSRSESSTKKMLNHVIPCKKRFKGKAKASRSLNEATQSWVIITTSWLTAVSIMKEVLSDSVISGLWMHWVQPARHSLTTRVGPQKWCQQSENIIKPSTLSTQSQAEVTRDRLLPKSQRKATATKVFQTSKQEAIRTNLKTVVRVTFNNNSTWATESLRLPKKVVDKRRPRHPSHNYRKRWRVA